MAKKKKTGLLAKLLPAVAALLGLATVVMLCAPGLALKPDLQGIGVKGDISLAKLAFGSKDDGVAFSFLLFLPYLLVLAGIAGNVLGILGKGGKVVPVISAGCYVAAGVLFFLVMQTFCVYVPDTTLDAVKDAYVETAKKVIKETMTLGIGAILSGVFAILSAAASIGGIFVKK